MASRRADSRSDRIKPLFFATPADFRRWLKKNHKSETELWVGFYRKGSGKPSITWPEAVDEALCFGWIDGIRKKVDEESYANRFTPRRSGSNWSEINIRRCEALIREGRMQPAGLKLFEERDPTKSGLYSFEQRKNPEFDATIAKVFRANRSAWKFFQAQPPGYRRLMTFFVMSAKREETRIRRLQKLMDASAAGRRLDQM